MTPQDIVRDVAVEVARAAPPVTVSGASLFGALTLPQVGQLLVCVATLLFIGMQAAYLRWKWNRDKAAAKQHATVPPPQ